MYSAPSLLYFAPTHSLDFRKGFFLLTLLAAWTCFPSQASLIPPRPHSSVIPEHRNFHLYSIDYASRPRLRSRLTRGRSALPRKPWISGRKDSHLTLATHSGILSSMKSTAPYSTASSLIQCSPTAYIPPWRVTDPWLRCGVSAPCIFGAGPLDQ